MWQTQDTNEFYQTAFSDPFWNGKTGQHVAWNTDRYQQAACISHSQMILTSRWAVGRVSGAAGCRILEAMQKGRKCVGGEGVVLDVPGNPRKNFTCENHIREL